jgi:hypothetical protein
MDNQVANSNTAGWHTVLGSSTPASMQMQIDAIQLYQPAGSGYTVTGANVSASTSTSPPVVTPPVTSPPVISTPVTPPSDTQNTASSGGGVESADPPVNSSPPVTSPPATSSVHQPILTVEDNSLSINKGGTIDLGLGVQTSDPNDAVTVNISGLPRYATITNNLDDQVFGGKNVSLSAAQVESGLTLSSASGSWGGRMTLVATATATDPVTGAIATSKAQTVTVTNSAGAYFGRSSSHADHSFSLLNQYMASGRASDQMNSGQITTAASRSPTWHGETCFTRPQH